ncbi:MAG: hypothetical protein Q4D74_04855, partial [Comamonadaceae bacterium]|nr:hypothetical protein [Comamonadaceae bacterium]
MVNPLDPHSLYALPDETDVLINPTSNLTTAITWPPWIAKAVVARDRESVWLGARRPANPPGPRERALNS